MSAVTDSKSSQRLQDLSATFLINTIAQKSLYLAHKQILAEFENQKLQVSDRLKSVMEIIEKFIRE